MKTDKEINNEIANLRKLLALKDRWNRDAREQLEAQVEVLESRMTLHAIERKWWVDETTEEYQGGDNETYHEAARALRWMTGSEDEAPSEDAL